MMQNPFEILTAQLSNIESLLLDIKHGELKPTTPLDPSTGKRYLNAAEAAGFMGIKLQTLYQNIDKVPHVKKFGKLAFVESDLVAYMETGRNATKRASENTGAEKSRKGTTNG